MDHSERLRRLRIVAAALAPTFVIELALREAAQRWLSTPIALGPVELAFSIVPRVMREGNEALNTPLAVAMVGAAVCALFIGVALNVDTATRWLLLSSGVVVARVLVDTLDRLRFDGAYRAYLQVAPIAPGGLIDVVGLAAIIVFVVSVFQLGRARRRARVAAAETRIPPTRSL